MMPAEELFRSGVRILTVPRATEGRGRAVGAGWFGDVRRDTGPPAPMPLFISVTHSIRVVRRGRYKALYLPAGDAIQATGAHATEGRKVYRRVRVLFLSTLSPPAVDSFGGKRHKPMNFSFFNPRLAKTIASDPLSRCVGCGYRDARRGRSLTGPPDYQGNRSFNRYLIAASPFSFSFSRGSKRLLSLVSEASPRTGGSSPP